MENDNRAQRLLFWGLLLGLGVLKISVSCSTEDYGTDGCYYLDLARHVRDGEGLVTNLSLYHAGFSSFPGPSPIYPLWPLLLGWVARVVPLDVAALALPGLFYVGCLPLAYRFAAGFSRTPLLRPYWNVPHAGHLAMLLLGISPKFFEATSQPYTEGLGFFLMLLALLRMKRLIEAPGSLTGLEAGAWWGILLLTRAQFLVGVLAFGAAVGFQLLLALLRRDTEHGLKLAAFAGTAATGFGLALLPQWHHLSTFLEHPTFSSFIRFEQFHATPGLSTVALLAQPEGSWIGDRLMGFLVAFDANNKYSYARSFGLLYWCFPLSIPTALRLLPRWREALDRTQAYPLFITITAVAWFLSLQALHKTNFDPWNFHLRHAMPCLLLFGASAVWLLLQQRGWRLLGLYLVSNAINFMIGQDTPENVALPEEDKTAIAALLPFIQQKRQEDEDLRVILPDPQRLSRNTVDVGYHWINRNTQMSDLRQLVGPLQADLLLLPEDCRYRFLKDPDFLTVFQSIPAPDGWMAFVPQERP